MCANAQPDPFCQRDQVAGGQAGPVRWDFRSAEPVLPARDIYDASQGLILCEQHLCTKQSLRDAANQSHSIDNLIGLWREIGSCVQILMPRAAHRSPMYRVEGLY